MFIKEKFEKLSMKDIVLLYLIVVMVYSTTYIYSDNLVNYIFPSVSSKSNSVIPIKLPITNNLKNIHFSDVMVVTYLNDTSKKYHIEMLETTITHNRAKIRINGEIKEMIHFLFTISHNFKLLDFEMNKVKSTIGVSLLFDTEYFYENNKKYKDIGLIFDPFSLQTEKNTFMNTNVIVSAIVKEEVLIDNIWYKQGDIVLNSKIIKISEMNILIEDIQTHISVLKSVYHE